MAEFKDVKDSGKRQEFTTGSKRDTDEGKGQPHLLPGEAMSDIKNYIMAKNVLELTTERTIEGLLFDYNEIVENKEQNIDYIYEAIILTMDLIATAEDGTYSTIMRRFSQHYANGAKKYDKNNWRKGQPISRYYDSAMRHLWAIIDKKTEEDHLSALLWNLVAIIQTKIDINKGLLPQELNDFPFTIKETFPNKD